MNDDNPDTELTKDTVFEILSSSRRRFALYVVCYEGGHMDLDALARRLAAYEEDVQPDAIESEEAKRLYISLYQTHLPKLASAELVDYDREERTVRLTDRVEELVAFLRTDTTPPRAWPRWYVTLAVVAILLTTAALAVPGLTTVLAAILVVDLLLVCAVGAAQWRWERNNAADVEAQLEAIV